MDDIVTGMITGEEKEIAGYCMEYALECGAGQVRVSLSKSVLDTLSLLNGTLDKVTRCADRSVYIYIFADGRYGTYSTNRLDRDGLAMFIRRAVENTRLLAPDEFRRLPSPERTAKDAGSGMEAGLYDRTYAELDADAKRALALRGTIFGKPEAEGRGFRLISEECEYSDSIEDSYTIDSQGFEGRHTETSFSYWSEMTIEDTGGNKYSGYWWESSPRFRDMEIEGCSVKALQKAAEQIGPRKTGGGKKTMVVDNCVSSRLFSPILSALSASSIQQKSSFLEGTAGKKVFPEELTVMDMARSTGMPGARFFDTEGVATTDHAIIGNGVVKEYFVNTYMSGKLGIAPTIEGVSRPVISPFVRGTSMFYGKKEITLQDIVGFCSEGILVTGFNGGNCNPTTGDFSYGVEGFVFRDGKIAFPVREMVITGNMMTLWGNILAAGTDSRKGARWQIPTLAFSDVDFSA